MKVWFAREIKSEKREERRTLKGICEAVGVSYSTGKRRQDKDGGKTVYVVNPGMLVWEIWVGSVAR